MKVCSGGYRTEYNYKVNINRECDILKRMAAANKDQIVGPITQFMDDTLISSISRWINSTWTSDSLMARYASAAEISRLKRWIALIRSLASSSWSFLTVQIAFVQHWKVLGPPSLAELLKDSATSQRALATSETAAGPEGRLFFLAEVWRLGEVDAEHLQLFVSLQGGSREGLYRYNVIHQYMNKIAYKT